MNQPGMAAGGGGGPIGQTRNPVTTLLLSMLCAFYGLFQLMGMMQELRNYLKKDEIVPWHVLVPYWNLYVIVVKLPKWVAEAKQRAGSTNPNAMGFVMYLFIPYYALAADLNEVWNPRGQLPAGAAT